MKQTLLKILSMILVFGSVAILLSSCDVSEEVEIPEDMVTYCEKYAEMERVEFVIVDGEKHVKFGDDDFVNETKVRESCYSK
jgi:hypothetical protein